jgi:biopolymer transport protein ExbD
MYTAQQVRAKQRIAIKRREDDIEQMEIEGGEINLIPYLDIVTNLVLFFLASVSMHLLLAQINTQLPDQQKGPPDLTKPELPPDEVPLRVTVSITREKIILWSLTGLEGTLQQPKAVFTRTGRNGDSCDGGYMCESNTCCPSNGRIGDDKKCTPNTCLPSNDVPTWVYDYRALNKALSEIATRRYTGKLRKKPTYQAVLMPDSSVPYGTIISTMGAMRCQMPELNKLQSPCFLPSDDENLKKAADPIDKVGHMYDTDRAPYDPSKMALFHDIVFSPGIE